MAREWLLVTGPTHGGTRLLVSVLSRHPEIATPETEALSVAEDYPWLHNLFMQAVETMGLHEARAAVDPDELAFVLDAYADACGPGRYRLVKLPNYPPMAREAFEEAIDLARVVSTNRASEPILASKRKRGRDAEQMANRRKFLFQTKKCLVEDRKRVLNAHDYETLHEAHMRAYEARIEAWQDDEEAAPVTRLRADDVVERPERLADLLTALDMSTDPLEEMRAVVDRDRLQQEGLVYRLKRRGLRAKNWVQARLAERS
jgi:hypothetical protein